MSLRKAAEPNVCNVVIDFNPLIDRPNLLAVAPISHPLQVLVAKLGRGKLDQCLVHFLLAFRGGSLVISANAGTNRLGKPIKRFHEHKRRKRRAQKRLSNREIG